MTVALASVVFVLGFVACGLDTGGSVPIPTLGPIPTATPSPVPTPAPTLQEAALQKAGCQHRVDNRPGGLGEKWWCPDGVYEDVERGACEWRYDALSQASRLCSLWFPTPEPTATTVGCEKVEDGWLCHSGPGSLEVICREVSGEEVCSIREVGR